MRCIVYIEFLNGEKIKRDLNLNLRQGGSSIFFRGIEYYVRANNNGECSLLLCSNCLSKAGRFHSEKGETYKCYLCDFVLPGKIKDMTAKCQMDPDFKDVGKFMIVVEKKTGRLKSINRKDGYNSKRHRVLKSFKYSGGVWRMLTGDEFLIFKKSNYDS